MKIVVLGTRGFPNIQGGVETHCEELYKRIGLEEEVKIVVYRRKNYLNHLDKTKYKNIFFKDFRVPTNKYFEALVHTFLGFFHSILFIRPDIIHIHNIGPGILCFLFKIFGIKVILTYHSQNYFHQKWNYFAKKALLLSEQISAKFSDAIIFVSESHRQEILAKTHIKKNYYIPNGLSYIENDPNYSAIFLKENDLTPQKFLLFVGRISSEKGLDYLIEAYIKSPKIQHIPLIVVGGYDGNLKYFEKIKELAFGNNIRFLGQKTKKELSVLYRNCSLFILPSYFEGNPIVLLEAISYKAKIIASNIKPNLEVGLEPKNYFKCADKNSLSKALENVLEEEETSNIELNKEYSWDYVANATFKVYKEVLNEG